MNIFVNTVEAIGDEVLTGSIIDKSITELNDNISVSIKQYAFRACSALASVNFPNVTSVALGAFWQCTALTKADFASCVTFANNAFYGCTALSALILRCTDQLCTITDTPFAGSAIANGTGYIYVPAVLVDQYKASWTAYAEQVRAIEDYPGVGAPYSWAGVFANIDNGTYASVYKVGDLVPLDLGSEGLVNMQIAGINVDDLADGSGKAPISWISKELLATKHRMNPERVTNDDGTYQEGTGAIGGWEKCEMRTYLKDTIYPLIQSDVQERIKTVTKYSDSLSTSAAPVDSVATADNVWIPSGRELGSTTQETTGVTYTELFSMNGAKKIPVNESYSESWWTRTAKATSTFIYVNSNGGYSNDIRADKSYYIALGFCT